MKDNECNLSDKDPSKPVFMIMAGGTGGHIFPGLAVADELMCRGFSIHWLGTHHGMEAELIPKYNLPISFLPVKGVRGKGIKALLMAPWRVLSSTFQAMRVMRKVKPVGILGMGGFVAGPGSLAAKMLGLPLVIHEQNAVEGMTNRLAAPMAKKILVAFPEAFSGSNKAIFTGNPVRRAIKPATVDRSGDHGEPLRLLILGGSRGALAVNETVPEALSQLSNPVNIWHQTGANHEEKTQELYDEYQVDARIQPFIDDMADAYAWADLVICRSGALTIAELANAGKPSILVPYPWHKDQQQLRNAEYLVKNKAALLIQQKELTADKLAQAVEKLAANRKTLQSMSQAACTCAKPDAAERIATICEEVTCG